MRSAPAWLVFASMFCAVACGGEEKNGGGGGDGSPTSGGPKSKTPPIECLDLPGATRAGLQLGPDGSAVYWRERAGVDEEAPWSLQTIAVAGGQPKKIADNVADQYRVLADGRVVFVRNGEKHKYLPVRYGQLTITTPDGATVQLNGNEEQIRAVDLSPDGKTIVYTRTSDFQYEVAKVGTAAGDQPAKLGEGYTIEGWTDKGEAIVFVGMSGGVVAMDLADGKTRPMLDIVGKLVGVAGNNALVLLNDMMMSEPLGGAAAAPAGATTDAAAAGAPAAPSPDPAAGSAPAAAMPVPGPPGSTSDMIGTVPKELGFERHGASLHLMGREHDAWVVKRFENGALTDVARSATVRIEDAVTAGTTLVVLARIDTDGDGSFTDTDETDVCKLQLAAGAKGPVDIAPPLREVPKKWLPKLEALKALATGQLEGAKIRIADATPPTVGFDVPAPATDIEALRAVVRELGPKVATATGDERVTTEIMFADGKVARLRWRTDAGKAFTEAGVGVAVVSNPAEFEFEVDPKITTFRENRGYGQPDTVGEAECSGTVTNRTTAAVEGLEIVCINKPSIQEDFIEPVTGPLKPKKLDPGKSGTYKVKIPVAMFEDPFETQLRVGGKPVAYYNAYAEKVSAAVLPVATELQAKADLVYMGRRNGQRQSYPRDAYTYVVLRAGKGFMEASAAEQSVRIGDALTALAKPLTEENLADAAILGPTGWTIISRYESGRLTPVE